MAKTQTVKKQILSCVHISCVTRVNCQRTLCAYIMYVFFFVCVCVCVYLNMNCGFTCELMFSHVKYWKTICLCELCFTCDKNKCAAFLSILKLMWLNSFGSVRTAFRIPHKYDISTDIAVFKYLIIETSLFFSSKIHSFFKIKNKKIT